MAAILDGVDAEAEAASLEPTPDRRRPQISIGVRTAIRMVDRLGRRVPGQADANQQQRREEMPATESGHVRLLAGYLHDDAMGVWPSQTATMATVQLATDVALPSQSFAEHVQTWVSANRQHFWVLSAGHDNIPAPVKLALSAPLGAHWQNPSVASALQV